MGFRYPTKDRAEMVKMLGATGETHVQSIEMFISEVQADRVTVTADMRAIKHTHTEIETAKAALDAVLSNPLAREIMATRDGLSNAKPTEILETARLVLDGIDSTLIPWLPFDGRRKPSGNIIAWLAVEWLLATGKMPTVPNWQVVDEIRSSAFGDFVALAIAPLGMTASRDVIGAAIRLAKEAEPELFLRENHV